MLINACLNRRREGKAFVALGRCDERTIQTMSPKVPTIFSDARTAILNMHKSPDLLNRTAIGLKDLSLKTKELTYPTR